MENIEYRELAIRGQGFYAIVRKVKNNNTGEECVIKTISTNKTDEDVSNNEVAIMENIDTLSSPDPVECLPRHLREKESIEQNNGWGTGILLVFVLLLAFIYYYPNRDVYKGEYKDGKRNGKGILYFANGNRYEGEWKDDKRNGEGILYSANGDRYEGEWKDDKVNGKGIFYFVNEDRFEGGWKDGNKDGK